jgi:chemotaxis protein methyltransferase WspC
LPRTIDNRMKANGLTTAERYLELLTADPDEIEALAAELVVSETWFFRGGQPLFQRLAQFVADCASGRPPGFPVRALSLP